MHFTIENPYMPGGTEYAAFENGARQVLRQIPNYLSPCEKVALAIFTGAHQQAIGVDIEYSFAQAEKFPTYSENLRQQAAKSGEPTHYNLPDEGPVLF